MNIELLGEILLASKGQLQHLGKMSARDLIEAGEHDSLDLLVRARKAQELLTAFIKELDYTARSEAEMYKGPFILHGANVSIANTGDRLDYEQDIIYADLKQKLKERGDLIKLAQGQDIYDDSGVKVPKVDVKTPSKETLKIAL